MGEQKFEGERGSRGRVPKDVAAYARALSEPQHRVGGRLVVGDWVVVLIAVLLAERDSRKLSQLLAIIVIGSRQRALGNLVHEASHRKLTRSQGRRSALLSAAVAAPLLVRVRPYRRSHASHHRDLWNSEKDPDWQFYDFAGTEVASSSWPRFLARHVLGPLCLYQTTRRIKHELGTSDLASRRNMALGVAATAVAFAIYPSAGLRLARHWVVPWFTSYQIIRYWAELGEHAGLSGRDVVGQSRNWEGNFVSRFLLGSHQDDPYHRVHHLWPAIPCNKLEEMDRYARENWPDYAEAEDCGGFFRGGRSGNPSVLRSIYEGPRKRALRVSSGGRE